MSLGNQWNAAQRQHLRAQLCRTSRAFVAALPAEDAVDGLIMNLHLCRALEYGAEELQEIFGRRGLAFLGGMAAAAGTENVAPRYKVDLHPGPQWGRPPVVTQIGAIGPDGRLRAAGGLNDGTLHIYFRRAPGHKAP